MNKFLIALLIPLSILSCSKEEEQEEQNNEETVAEETSYDPNCGIIKDYDTIPDSWYEMNFFQSGGAYDFENSDATKAISLVAGTLEKDTVLVDWWDDLTGDICNPHYKYYDEVVRQDFTSGNISLKLTYAAGETPLHNDNYTFGGPFDISGRTILNNEDIDHVLTKRTKYDGDVTFGDKTIVPSQYSEKNQLFIYKKDNDSLVVDDMGYLHAFHFGSLDTVIYYRK